MANPLFKNNNVSNGLFSSAQSKKKKPKNPNPYQEGTPDYINWEGANKAYKSNKNIIYGGNKSAQESYAAYWNNEKGDWEKGSLAQFSEKERKHVIGNRNKVINYMYDNNLNSLEDWESHEVKDKDVDFLWNKNPDIGDLKLNLIDYVKNNREYGFDPIPTSSKSNKPSQKNKPEYNWKNGSPVAPIDLSRTPLEDTIDPIEANFKKKQGQPLSIPKPLIAEEPKKKTGLPLGNTKGIDLDDMQPLTNDLKGTIYNDNRPPHTELQNDNVKTSIDLDYEIKEKELQKEEQAKYKKEQYPLVKKMQEMLDVKYEDGAYQFDIKEGMSVNDVKQSVEDFTVELIDERLQTYASEKGLSGEALNILRAKARERAEIEDTVYDNYDKRLIDSFIPDSDYYKDLPDEVKSLTTKYHDMLEDLGVIDSYKRLNKTNKLVIPRGLDPNELSLSVARGVSPGILNSTLEAITGIENFDIATTFKNFADSGPTSKVNYLFTNPSLVFSKEYQDVEVMDALGSMLADKYEFNTEEFNKNPDKARANTLDAINKAYKEIASETDTWSFQTRVIANSTAELLSNLATGWRASGMLVEKIGEKALTLKKYASAVNMEKLSKMPQFQKRAEKFQRMLQGSSEIGGKNLMPTYTELFGHPVTNIARTTATSFGSHLYTQGMDFDNALEASENMFALEVFNQMFAIGGVKAYKTLNLLNRSFKKLPNLPSTQEAIAKYQKHMNTVYLASSFPAQAAFTKAMNPDATDKELAGELIMNAIVGYNTLLTNRHLAGQLKSYKAERKMIEDHKANWSSENRKIDIVEPHDYSRAEELRRNINKEGGTVHITPEKELYDPATGKEVRQKTMYTDLTPGFHDYARETVGKKEGPLKVGDFQEFVSKDLPEELQPIATKLFDNSKDIKVESFDDPESTKPAFYDKGTKTIFLNSALKEASSPEQLKATIVHEGVHALTDNAYSKDKDFKSVIDEYHKELVDSPEVKDLLSELSSSTDTEQLSAYDNLSYALSHPEELITMMFDPLMKDAKDQIAKLDDGNWIKKWWNNLKNLFGKGEASNIDKIKEFVESYDFTPIKEEEAIADEPLDIDKEVVFQRSIVPEAQLNELNTLRKEMKLPSISEKEFLDMFTAEYGLKPVSTVLNRYAQKLKRDLINTKEVNSMETIVNDIQKGKELIEDGVFLEKSDVKFLKDFYNQPNMGVVINKSQGKEISVIKDKLRKGIDIKFANADEISKDQIATYHANKISQKKVVEPVAIEIAGGRATVTPVRGNYYDGIKPVDKTMGQTHYLSNWKDNFTNSLRSETGRLKPYANERILSFFERFDPDNNLTTIAGTSVDGTKTNGFKNPEFITPQIAGQLLNNDYYLLPRGNKTETMLRIPGLSNVLAKKESAKDFGRQVQRFSFFRWIDSDSQWIGSKEGVYKGRELAELSQYLDFDRMIDKFVAGKNVAYDELFTVSNKNVLPDDIELLGSKLKDYYTDTKGEIYNPQYYNIDENASQGMINNLMLNSITDLMTWGIDAGGSSRTITSKDGIVSQAKNPWKYHSLLASNDPTYASAEYLKPFLGDAINEDGSWDERALKEKGITIRDGEAFVKTAYLDPEMYADIPFMGNLLGENATDGATFVSNKRLFDLISDTMLKNSDDTAILKPKWHDTDAQGNMSMFKTALYDYGFDEYTKKMNPEMMQFMGTVKDAVGFLSFQTSNKGSNTFRTKEHPVSHTDNSKARAIFDNSGKLVDVIVKSDGEYKSDTKLFEAETQYIKERLAQGIIDPRMIQEMPITGSNGVSFIESSHPISKTNAGSLGINQVPMFNPLFEFFRENPEAYKALENLEDKTIAKAVQGMKDVYNLRTLLEGTRRIALDQAKGSNESSEKLLEHGFVDDEALASGGRAINGVIDSLKDNIKKAEKDVDNGNDEFMFPGLSNEEALSMLQETLDGEGKLIPEKIYNLYLAGNSFVSGMKNSKAGEKSQLIYQLQEYFEDGILSRGYGANTYIMPDMESGGAIARLYEPLIQKHIDNGELVEAEALQEQYQLALEENIDENGRLKAFSKGVIVGKDIIEKFNLKPGDRAFLKLTPTDDLHSLTPVIIAGVSNKPGVSTFNTEFLTEVLGRDFDKDAMQIVVQNNDYMSKKDFDTVWDAYDKSGMSEGKYKKNTEVKDREKQLVNGQFKPIENMDSYDPTSVPQAHGYYGKVQDSHGNVGSMIATRNIITNGLRNLQWEDNKALLGKNQEIELEMKDGMSDRINYIVQKMVDKYDFMPINPNEAIMDEFISKYKGKDFSELDYKMKDKIRNQVRNELESIGGYGVKKIKDSNDFREVNSSLKNMNVAGPSVSSKMAKAVTGIRVKTSNGPEVNKYKFYNDLGERLQSEATDMIAKYQTVIDPKLHHHMFNSYKNSSHNIGEHLGNLFESFTNTFVTSKTEGLLRENILKKDIYNYISNPDFKAFSSNSPWKEVAAGTLLHDMFNNNADKDISKVKNKVFKGGDKKAYEYTYDGYNGFIESEGNKVTLSDIFDNEGKLLAEWLPADVLESSWLRTFIDKTETPSDLAKAQLIGRTIANVSKNMAPKVGIPEGDLFSMLVFNSTGNVTKVERTGSKQEGYAKSIGSWVYGKPRNKLSNAQLERMKKEVDRELRYDPLYIIDGAKKVGLTPTINEVPMVDFFKKFAKEQGEQTFGKNERMVSDTKRGMPDFKYRTSNLDIKTPKRFIESINNAVGEYQAKGELIGLIEKPMTEYSNEDYRLLFDKILEPGIKKLVKDKGSEIGWDEKAIENISKQYISALDPMHTEYILNSIKRDFKGKDKDFQLKTAHTAQLAQIASSLNKHFKVKDPSSLAFSRIFGGRDGESMLNDLSNDKELFKRTDVIVESFKVKNGELVLTEDPVTKEKIHDFVHYTVGDLVNKELGVSGGDALYSKAFIKLVAPYKFADKVREASMAAMDSRIDNETFGKDIRGENNIRISKAIDELSFKDISDDQVTIADALKDINVESTFNGILKDTDNVASYKEISSPENDENKLGMIASEMIKDYTNQEADAIMKFNEKLPEEDRDIIDFDSMVSKNMKYIEPIKDAIKMKIAAMESANYLIGNAQVIDNIISSKEHLLSNSQIAEVTAKTEKMRELASKLSSNDTKEVFKNYRKLNYENDKTIELLHSTIYEKSKKTIQEYGKVRDKISEKWKEPKYILRKEFIPEVFKDMPGSDNIPFFTLMITKFQQDLTSDMVQNKAYSDELMSKYKNMASKVLRRLEPELNDAEHSTKTNQMLQDLIKLSEYRHNINHRLYRMGNELGLKGFEEGVDKASQDDIVKKGFKLRKEVERQFENIMKRLDDSYEISMIDGATDDPFIELEGIELNFGDFLTSLQPEIAYDPTHFTYSANNLKDKVKNAQISALGGLENVLKTHYIKDYAKDNKVAEAVVLSELGHISGNKSVYNNYHSKETLKEANIEAGTDGFVRYNNKVGGVNTIYGKILGSRDVTYTGVKDLSGKPRIEKRKMLFVVNEKGEGNKLHVINIDAIEDAVTGVPYGGKLAQPTMANETIKKQYSKNSDKLLDDLAKRLSKTSKFAKGNFKNRREGDEFVKYMDQRYRAHDLNGALKTFESEMVFNQDQIDKSFAKRLERSQDLMTNFLVADKYLGLRYLAGIGLGAGAIGAGVVTSPALVTMGLGYMAMSTGKYGARIGRIFIQNMVGNTAYAFRNASDQTFLWGNIKALGNATINNIVNLKSMKNSNGKLSDIKVASLKAGSNKTQITDSFDMTEEGMYENKDNTSLRKAWKKKRLVDKNIERFEQIQKLKDEWKAKGNYNDSVEAVRDQLMKDMKEQWTYKKKITGKVDPELSAELTFVEDIPFVNGKPLTSYQKAQVGTFAFVNHLLSLNGKMVLAEALSAEAGFNTNKAVFDKYIEDHSKRSANYSDEKSLFEYNLMETALHKTIGNYSKTTPQYTFLRRISEMFSRFSHEQKLDQTVYWNKRREFYDAVNSEVMKDKNFAKFKGLMDEVGGIPLGGYKVNAPKKEMALNATVAIMTGGLKLAGLGLAYAGAEDIADDIDSLGDNIGDIVGDGESWFGLTFVPMSLGNLFAELGGLYLTEDGKSPRTSLQATERAAGNLVSGFTGLGPTILAEETAAWTNIALYMYYMDDMKPGDRRKTIKYMEDIVNKKSYETASELLAVPGLNQVIKEIPNAKKKIEKKDKPKRRRR